MNHSEIILDAIAEVVATEKKTTGDNLLAGMSEVILALCCEAGLDETAVRAELKKRVLKIRASRINIQIMIENLN